MLLNYGSSYTRNGFGEIKGKCTIPTNIVFILFYFLVLLPSISSLYLKLEVA